MIVLPYREGMCPALLVPRSPGRAPGSGRHACAFVEEFGVAPASRETARGPSGAGPSRWRARVRRTYWVPWGGGRSAALPPRVSDPKDGRTRLEEFSWGARGRGQAERGSARPKFRPRCPPGSLPMFGGARIAPTHPRRRPSLPDPPAAPPGLPSVRFSQRNPRPGLRIGCS